MSELKIGEKVYVKSLGYAEGIVKHVGPAEVDAPPEDRFYRIAFERYVSRDDIETEEESRKYAKPAPYSREWVTRMEMFNRLGNHCLSNPQDEESRKKWIELGADLGFLIPAGSTGAQR